MVWPHERFHWENRIMGKTHIPCPERQYRPQTGLCSPCPTKCHEVTLMGCIVYLMSFPRKEVSSVHPLTYIWSADKIMVPVWQEIPPAILPMQYSWQPRLLPGVASIFHCKPLKLSIYFKVWIVLTDLMSTKPVAWEHVSSNDWPKCSDHFWILQEKQYSL